MIQLRVAYVDDDSVMLETLPHILAPHDVRVVWTAADGAGALRLLARHDLPDVLLADIAMPGMTGHEVALRARALHPSLPVVMLTAIDTGNSLRDALACGARGYLVKHDPPERMAHLLRLAADGQLVFSESPAARLAEDYEAHHPGVRDQPLTSRQIEVLRLAGLGHSNQSIARQLGCTQDTIKKHLAAIYAKLEAHDRASAVAIAIRASLI